MEGRQRRAPQRARRTGRLHRRIAQLCRAAAPQDGLPRAGFIGHPLWVTAFDPDERYAAGDTPNQNPETPGLPQYVGNNEALIQRDLVLWLTIGHHHVTQAEDWPVLSRHRMAFELKPANFFDRNPAVDLRRAPFEAR